MARRDRNGHGLNAVRVVGGLLPPEFLQTIARLNAKWQTGTDYGLSKSLVLKDEIARYWRIASDLYAAYDERRKRSDLDIRRISIDEWLTPFLKDILGYSDLTVTSPIAIGDRRFPVSHSALTESVPMLLTSGDIDLDKADPQFGDEGRRRAPYGLVQELLNADDRKLWGLVSNGSKLRLLRDNPTLTRPAYIEADLARIFDEQLYADFAALWLTIHASRLHARDGEPYTSILETWRSQANETGERALEHLRHGVTAAIRALANGFVQHPRNDALRAAIQRGSLTADSLFQELLRLVYRLLFLFASEDRNLLHVPEASDDTRQLYRDGYSLSRLRDRALRRRHYDRHGDLWNGLGIVFAGLSNGVGALGLPPLGGLFGREQCVNLDTADITNEALLEAILALAYFRSGSTLSRVNYRDMGTEELGSVYESLLELHPYLDVNTAPWAFGFVGEDNGEKTKGSARKLTGSYYTPSPLVQELIRTTLEPVMQNAVEARRDNPRQALLALKVIDPACGSGHFLLAAARRIAAEIARIEANADTPEESVRQHALREVVQHCIYGVDRNPLAVELCKAALWIETVEPGKPLSFLDPHIQCGDSLVGLLDPATIGDGIPDGAYKPLTGDDGVLCRHLKRRNAESGQAIQGSLFEQHSLKIASEITAAIDAMPEETLEEITAKREAWRASQNASGLRQDELLANLFVGAFLTEKNAQTRELVPITEDLQRVTRGMSARGEVHGFVQDIAARYRFFHWYLAFPEIMQRGGFDVVLGNPPWERVKLQEQEFFANRSPLIAKAPNKTARTSLIKALQRADATIAEQALFRAFEEAKHAAEAAGQFIRTGGRYVLTGSGDINTYALFAETFLSILSPRGRAGIVVPTGIATEDTNSEFFAEVVSSKRLSSLYSFYEIRRFFKGTDSRQPFCLMTLKGKDVTGEAATFCFALESVDGIKDPNRTFKLAPSEMALLSPNTRTSPIFRSNADAELTKAIYSRVPVLLRESPGDEANAWGVGFMRMFDMTNDSGLFKEISGDELHAAQQLCSTGGYEAPLVPLYEAKMVYQYDHRYGTFAGISTRPNGELPRPSPEQYDDPNYLPQPWYWVSNQEVHSRLENWRRRWLFVFRGITNTASERTAIFGVIPAFGVGNSAPAILLEKAHESPSLAACFIANVNSLPFDYCIRQKVSGLNLNFHFLKQSPVLPPTTYTEADIAYIVPRVAELAGTGTMIKPFLDDLWLNVGTSVRTLIEQQWNANLNASIGHARYTLPSKLADAAGFPYGPFKWDDDRRSRLRAELDAYFARLYGLGRDDLRYVLDPSDVYGEGYPSQTFRVLKEREMKQYGEYRTARLVLSAWDNLEANGGLASIA